MSLESRPIASTALYALTIFAGAFLLFAIQPIIAKIILPWFGGSAAVWITCMLFFQVMLLLGYWYAHLLKQHPRLHIALLAASLLVLPVIPSAGWKPSGTEDPALRILGLLAVTIGLPYFLLSSTSPLLQAWYSRQAVPYRLFALSNLGSMLALVSYPFLIEPAVSTRHQAIAWSAGYAVFVLLCGAVAWRARGPGSAHIVTEPRPPGSGLWFALAATASALLLAVTNHLTQNVAPIPFLWILPLTLYLLSFILSFEGWYRRYPWLPLAAVGIGGMGYATAPEMQNVPLFILIPLFAGGLFVCCMACHGELALLKPHPRHLTSFYLMIALGGAAGGIFAGLIAPRVFSGYFELPIAIACCAVLLVTVAPLKPVHRIAAAALAVALAVYLGVNVREYLKGSLLAARNFYGTLRVTQRGGTDDEYLVRELKHGSITHGKQVQDAEERLKPTTYFGPNSGAGLALRELARRPKLRVGIVGLGAGTLAAYGRAGDEYRFYEINPLVTGIAGSQFTYLRDSKAKVKTILGDARLSLEREPPQQFDLLAVDAFSGDAIPVHLLTREAVALYFRHLRNDGVLAMHLSNRYLVLAPVVQLAADSLGRTARIIEDEGDKEELISKTTWVLVSARPDFFEGSLMRTAAHSIHPKPGLRLWTDDYSNVFQILK